MASTRLIANRNFKFLCKNIFNNLRYFSNFSYRVKGIDTVINGIHRFFQRHLQFKFLEPKLSLTKIPRQQILLIF